MTEVSIAFPPILPEKAHALILGTMLQCFYQFNATDFIGCIKLIKAL